MFTKKQIHKAKQLRIEAAQKWNCAVSEIYWPACVALASQNDMKSLKERILESDEVVDYKDWTKGNNNRTYLTLKGSMQSYRGDNSCQVYFDNHTQELVVKRGKGMTSNSMDASIEAIQTIS